jgi:hypothetical protein
VEGLLSVAAPEAMMIVESGATTPPGAGADGVLASKARGWKPRFSSRLLKGRRGAL